MGGERKELSLREAGVRLLDCEHKTPPAAEEGYPYIAIPQIKNGRLDLTDVRLISRDHYIAWTRKTKPQGWDVILSRRCNPGETAVVPADLECALGQNLVLLRSGGDNVYPPFLRWLLHSPAWWDQVRTFINVGAVFESLKCADIPNFRLPIPPIFEQQAIACILGTLDDKIELNRRMNETLEAMARAIFKSWFVEFDPVRAKAAGQQPPGLKPDLAALFSDAFENSELGEIPSGWRVRPIGDVVQVLGGGTPSTKEPAYWEGGIHPFCTPKDMASLTDPVLLQTERHLTDEGLAKVSSGKLPVGTVLLSSRAPIGYLAIAETPVSINQGIIAMVCDGELPNLYVLHWTSANMDRVIANANGSTFLEISKRNFRPITAVIPQGDILERFTQIVGPLHERVVSSLRQILHLAAIRDALLPRLISGELAVAEAERIAGRCA
jgi:type I restriction enzyme S subunit